LGRTHNIPASYLILLREDEVLLLQRKNTGFRDGMYSFIAGHVEEGESFTDAVIREAEEEAGVRIRPEDLSAAHIMHRRSDDSVRVDVFFTAREWTGSVENREPHKCGDLSWFPLDALPDNTIPYIREALDHIARSSHYSENGWTA